MNIHKLNIENHSHIIGRQDGITGDSIKEDDEVVFCAACQSVFLKDSWKYMSGKHCDQFRTLRFMPEPTPNLIIRNGIKITENVIFEFKNEFLSQINELIKLVVPFAMRNIFLLLASVVIALMWIFIPNDAYNGQKTEYTLFLSVIILFVSHYFKPMWTETRSKELENLDFINTNSGLKILETGIILGKNFHNYNQIQKVTTSKSEKKHKFTIELKDNSKFTKDFSLKNYERTKPFYLALAWTAQFVEVHFQAEDKREQRLLRRIEQNYAGRIFIAESSALS